MCRNSVDRFPDRPALGYRPVSGGVAQPYLFYSYSEVADYTAKLASAFVKFGLKRGDKVGVYGPNCP